MASIKFFGALSSCGLLALGNISFAQAGGIFDKPFDKGGAFSIDKPLDKGGTLSIDKPLDKGGTLSIDKPLNKGGTLSIDKPLNKGGTLSIDKPFDKGGTLSINKVDTKVWTDAVDAAKAIGKFAERQVSGTFDTLSDAERRVREGKIVDAVWHQATDPLKRGRPTQHGLLKKAKC